jgi:hypothetical protein
MIKDQQDQARLKPKQVAHQLIDKLPDNATWDDVVYEMAMRQEIELGMADSDANRTTPVEDVIREFGFPITPLTAPDATRP